MKKLIFIFLIISSTLSAQKLKLKKAEMIETHILETSAYSSRCFIGLYKSKEFKWSIDSLVFAASGKKIDYSLVHINNRDAVSPDYKAVNSFSEADKGNYEISFTPVFPFNAGFNQSDQKKGVILYYTAKNKHKQLKVKSFRKIRVERA